MLIVDKVFNLQVEHTSALFDIPDPSRLVTRTRNKESTITGEIEGVNFLHVPLEKVADASLLKVPNLQKLYQQKSTLTEK